MKHFLNNKAYICHEHLMIEKDLREQHSAFEHEITRYKIIIFITKTKTSNAVVIKFVYKNKKEKENG